MIQKFIALLFVCHLFFSCGEEKRESPAIEQSDEPSPFSKSGPTQYLASSSDLKDRDYVAPWSVTQKILQGGKQQGVELLTLDNGKLKIVIIPTRGMGILEVTSGDLRLGWDSPVKEVVHPSLIHLDSQSGLGWQDGYNEWMARCGLEFAGHPGTDQYINKTGNKVERDLSLHGRIQNTPATDYKILVDPSPPHRIRVQGTVYETSFNGPNFKLVTEISTIPGSDHFQISDQITNQGSSHQEYQLIYKGSYGSSILEEGAIVFAPASKISPMNNRSAKSIQKWQTYRQPIEGFMEELYLLTPVADENSSTMALLANRLHDLATSVRWSVNELPCLTIWKNTASSEDGYVTGIEPGTSYPFNRLVERKYGRVPRLAPSETRTFTLSFGIHRGRTEVDKLIAEATNLQSQANLQIIQEPPSYK